MEPSAGQGSPETVETTSDGGEAGDRRQRDRRRGERRSGGRRAEDIRAARVELAWAAGWAVVGALVVLYLFFVVVGTVDPTEARAASIAVLVLAVAWLAHAWQRVVIRGGHVSRPDRERRGF
jgi:hypothetical protein